MYNFVVRNNLSSIMYEMYIMCNNFASRDVIKPRLFKCLSKDAIGCCDRHKAMFVLYSFSIRREINYRLLRLNCLFVYFKHFVSKSSVDGVQTKYARLCCLWRSSSKVNLINVVIKFEQISARDKVRSDAPTVDFADVARSKFDCFWSSFTFL